MSLMFQMFVVYMDELTDELVISCRESGCGWKKGNGTSAVALNNLIRLAGNHWVEVHGREVQDLLHLPENPVREGSQSQTSPPEAGIEPESGQTQQNY